MIDEQLSDQALAILRAATCPGFKPWGKTPRFFDLKCVVTEKIDGTNALVHITDDGKMFTGSRNRWIYPGKKTDNYGFAEWCDGNKEELLKLGAGWHYGEWWGQGIGRAYGCATRQFSLFNTRRWGVHNPTTPKCCRAVPILYEGPFTISEINLAVDKLRRFGSQAQPGALNVEGVIVYLPTFDQRMKIVLDKQGPSPIEAI